MRKRTREIAMELLYQNSINHEDYKVLIDDYFEESAMEDKRDVDMPYLEQVLPGVNENLPEIDSLIEKYLVNWKLNRVSKINMSILRLATYEIIYMKEIPNKVSIFEGVDLAKKYSDETAGAFVNGILDKIANQENHESIEKAYEERKVLDAAAAEEARIAEEARAKEEALAAEEAMAAEEALAKEAILLEEAAKAAKKAQAEMDAIAKAQALAEEEALIAELAQAEEELEDEEEWMDESDALAEENTVETPSESGEEL